MLLHCLAIAIHLNGVSHHIDADRDYNERNWGAGVSCEYEQGRRWSTDVLRDSDGKAAGYIAHEWDVASGSAWHTGIMAGAIRYDGYYEGKAAAPFALPYMGVDIAPVELRATVLPPMESNDPTVIAAQVRVQF